MPFFNLFTEKAGILDGDDDTEVDLASYAYQIWKNAIDQEPGTGEDHPGHAERGLFHAAPQPTADQPEGALGLPAHGRGQ